MTSVNSPDQTYKLKALYITFIGVWVVRYIKLPLETFWLKAFYKWFTNDKQEIQTHQIGYTQGLFFLFMAIGALSIGPLSSKLGRRPLILICLMGFSVTLLGQALSTTFLMVIIFTSLMGAFSGSMGLFQSYIVDVCETKDIIKYSSRLFLILGIVTCCSPIMVGLITYIFNHILRNTSYYHESLQYRATFIVGSFFAFAIFIYGYFKLEESFTINDINVTEITQNKAPKPNESMQSKLDTIYEDMLPETYKTPEFKNRIRRYLVILMMITFLLEVCVGFYFTFYPILAEDTLKWTQFQHSINTTIYGGSMALIQRYYPKRFRLLTVAAMGAFGLIISSISVPLMNMICMNYFKDSMPFVQLSLHSHISILTGAAYGIIYTAVATLFSDLAKKLNHKHVDNWLAGYASAGSLGMCSVLPQTYLAGYMGISKTILFVSAPAAMILFLLLIYLYFATKDISIATDMDKIIEQDKKLGQQDKVDEDPEAGGGQRGTHIDDLKRASRQSINKFMLGMGITSPVLSPAILLGIPMIDDETKQKSVTVPTPEKDLSVVIPTEMADEDFGAMQFSDDEDAIVL